MASASTRLSVRVTPRASKNRIDGFRGETLLVRVTAPPVDSAANDAVIELLAKALGVAKRDVVIASGAAARNKTVTVAGLSARELRERFSE